MRARSSPLDRLAVFALLASIALPARVVAQQGGHQHGGPQGAPHGGHARPAGASGAGDSVAAAAERAMQGHHAGHAAAHLRMTGARPATAADSARAAAVVAALRDATAKYADVRRAEADGYRMFAPGVKEQRVYHFTRRRAAIAEAFRFDPAQPTSLLYVKASDGTLKLLGAMYTAPRRASEEELDRRVPLSMARWHRHVNLCVPKRAARERWVEKDATGAPKFGPAGSIVTEQACEREDGRWLDAVFGWMVHVNAWADDPREVFEH